MTELYGDAPPTLTTRQRAILCHLCEGATDREIAARVYASERTVQREIGIARRVFRVANRTELAAVVAARRTASLPV